MKYSTNRESRCYLYSKTFISWKLTQHKNNPRYFIWDYFYVQYIPQNQESSGYDEITSKISKILKPVHLSLVTH